MMILQKGIRSNYLFHEIVTKVCRHRAGTYNYKHTTTGKMIDLKVGCLRYRESEEDIFI